MVSNELIAIWCMVGLLIASWNIYLQLFLADNWPPSNWYRIQWDAVVMLITLCLFCWPLVAVCMAIDRETINAYQRKRKAAP